MKEKEKKALTKAEFATISHYIELEQKSQRIERKTEELLKRTQKLIKKIERLIKYKKEGKEIAELEKDLQETKKYYLETKENLKDLNKIKIEIAKDYYKMGVNIDILSRYAHLTPKEIKEIENY